MSGATGGFEDVREEARDHPMVSLFRYATTYWKRLTVAIVASVINRAALLVPALTIAAAIDRVIQAPGEPADLARLGLVTSEQIPAEATAERLELLYVLVAIVIGAYVAQAIFRFTARYLFESTAQKIQHDLRHDTYDHMQHLSMNFYDDHETGGMMAILNSDINRLEEFINNEIRQIIRAIVIFSLVGVYLAYNAPRLAPLILVPMAVVGVGTYVFVRWIEPKYKRIRELVAELNARLANNLGGVEIIKTLDRYEVESERVDGRSVAYRDKNIEAIRLRKGFFASLRLVIGAMFATILLFGGQAVIEGTMTAGTFVVFFLYLRELDGPMRRIGMTANRYQKAKSSAERVFGILGHEPLVQGPVDGHDEEMDGDVSFDSVRFSYEGTDEIVLDGVSLDVPAGTTIGLAGTSGSGKSTLVKLLPRLYDVDDGRVTIDGVDVREWDLRRLRHELGIVEQAPYMFSGTVLENIAYGDRELFLDVIRSGGHITDEQRQRIESAAKAAGAHEFITNLPSRYGTEVGERGVKLSGGQRQRLSIARILLNDPSIIIFDEATSSVDTETEQHIQRNIDQLSEDRTAFIIAHRLSTIQDADRIVVMEDGRIVETGTHGELLDDGGTYADLWAEQTGKSVLLD